MITLPFTSLTRPLHRVLVSPSWGGNGGSWSLLPMVGTSPGIRSNGFEVLRYNRACLPAIGEATMRFRFGRINGTIVAPTAQTAAALGAGTPWDPTNANLQVSYPDLRRQEIRIQAAPRPAAGVVPAWRTVWWGQVEFQEAVGMPGASIPSGDVIYHCSDGFFRTKRWIMNRHGYTASDATLQGSMPITYQQAFGHPGYNAVDGMGTISGNNSQQPYDPTASANVVGDGMAANLGVAPISLLTWAGAGYIFSDLDAVNHACAVVKPFNDVLFMLSGQTGAFNLQPGASWAVDTDEPVWDFVADVCRRERGRGLVWCDWQDDTTKPMGPLKPRLSVAPQFLADVKYNAPQYLDGYGNSPNAAQTIIIKGATSAGTTTTVDLIGDHRVQRKAFALGDREQHRVDALESYGERMQVLTTASRFDAGNLFVNGSGSFVSGGSAAAVSLANRWSAAIATSFTALDLTQRISDAYRSVFQLYGLPHNWDGSAADHNGGKLVQKHRVDYRCNDDGSIAGLYIVTAKGIIGRPDDTSPILVEVMPDLPILEGYDYTSYPPVRRDGLTEQGMPPRRPPLILMRFDDDAYLPGEMLDAPMTIHVDKDGIFMHAPSDLSPDGATRVCSDMTNQAQLGASYDNSQMGCTIGLRLPHRVRYRSVGNDPVTGKPIAANDVRRVKAITHSNLHLWVASPGAIWELNNTPNANGFYAGKRFACKGSVNAPGLLRDDRAALQTLHNLACQWYLLPRRTARWALKDCGLLPSFVDSVRGVIPYPTIGQMVTTLAANGQVNQVNTPITAISYDNEACETTWETDWSDLDFR